MTSPLPPDVQRLLQQAQGQLAAQRYADAAATLASVMASAPECVPALGLAATAAHFRGQHEQAARWLRRAADLAPDDARLQQHRGRCATGPFWIAPLACKPAALGALHRLCVAYRIGPGGAIAGAR